MTIRVIQWATGEVGSWSLRQIIDSPDLELVGVWVSSEVKDGKDAGDICGRPSTGVRATTSKEAIFALEADVVIHCPRPVDADAVLPFDDDVCALLESGKNVISTLSYYSPFIEGDERMRRLEAACEAGSATLYGGGLDPGFVCDRVAALVSGSVSQIKQIRMVETLDVSRLPNGQLMNDVGLGKRLDELNPESPTLLYFVNRLFPAAVAKLADLLGVTLDEVRVGANTELTFAPREFEAGGHVFAAGTLAGGCYEYEGMRDGEVFITHRWVHYLDRDSAPEHWLKAPPPSDDAEAMPYLVRVEIDGRPSLRTDLLYTDVEDTVAFPTAVTCINAIPDVCEAAPGLLQERIFGAWRARQPSHV